VAVVQRCTRTPPSSQNSGRDHPASCPCPGAGATVKRWEFSGILFSFSHALLQFVSAVRSPSSKLHSWNLGGGSRDLFPGFGLAVRRVGLVLHQQNPRSVSRHSIAIRALLVHSSTFVRTKSLSVPSREDADPRTLSRPCSQPRSRLLE
jgi:hypothetical protein